MGRFGFFQSVSGTYPHVGHVSSWATAIVPNKRVIEKDELHPSDTELLMDYMYSLVLEGDPEKIENFRFGE
jgi:hypothetical protein